MLKLIPKEDLMMAELQNIPISCTFTLSCTCALQESVKKEQKSGQNPVLQHLYENREGGCEAPPYTSWQPCIPSIGTCIFTLKCFYTVLYMYIFCLVNSTVSIYAICKKSLLYSEGLSLRETHFPSPPPSPPQETYFHQKDGLLTSIRKSMGGNSPRAKSHLEDLQDYCKLIMVINACHNNYSWLLCTQDPGSQFGVRL